MLKTALKSKHLAPSTTYNYLTKDSVSPQSPTPLLQMYTHKSSLFNDFAQSLRLKYMRAAHTKRKHYRDTQRTTTTSYLHRRMKLLPTPTPETPVPQYSGHTPLEDYIDNTKQLIADNLPTLCHPDTTNFSKPQQTVLNKLRKDIQLLDKGLGFSPTLCTPSKWWHVVKISL